MLRHRHFSKILLACFCISLLNSGAISTVCASQKEAHEAPDQGAARLSGKVIEVINVAGYTYTQVDTGKAKVWAAGPPTPIEKGDRISFSSQMPMYNFHSNATGRDFPMIYFIGQYDTDGKMPSKTSVHSQLKQPVNEPVKGIEKIDGGYTIAEIYRDKSNLKGKTVRVRGKVSKFSADIMSKNWVHIRDSSTLDDLTITTKDTVAVDDVVVAEGVLELDKDFNYGYLYPVIMDGAKVTKE